MILKIPVTRVTFDKNDNIPVLSFITKEFDIDGDHPNQMYKILDCDFIQVVYVTILGKEYALICDEEGKLKPWVPTFPLKDENGEVYDIIANSYLLFKEDEDQNKLAFEEEELNTIIGYMRSMSYQALEAAAKILEK